jgi:hypothetical protein
MNKEKIAMKTMIQSGEVTRLPENEPVGSGMTGRRGKHLVVARPCPAPGKNRRYAA